MTAEELKSLKDQIFSGQLNTYPALQEIGEELLFNPRPNPRFLTELDVFLRDLHRNIYQNRKDLYTQEMADLLMQICAIASYAAENAFDEKKGQPFYLELERLGRLLIDNAPYFQILIGLLVIVNPQLTFLK